MKKILVVSNSSFFGGGENFILTTLSQISNTYFLIRDLTLVKELDNTRVRIFLEDSFWYQRAYLETVVKELSIDIVIFNGGSTIFFTPLIKGVKKIIIRHTTNNAVTNGFKRLVYKVILHFCYFFSNAIVHVSDYAMREQKLFKNKAYVIHNGAKECPQIKRDLILPLRVLYLGRVEPEKGIETIVKAFFEILPATAHLNIVGDGSLSEWLKGIKTSNITYHGFSRDVNRFYQQNDIFVLLSKFENCPYTIIDAMNWGMPIITTNVGGIPEMVFDGQNGIVVTPTIEDVIIAINRLATSFELVREMGCKSRCIFDEKYRLDRKIAQIEELVNNI